MALRRERRDDGVEILRLDRPERRNALDTALTTELAAMLEELAGADEVRVVVLSTTDTAAFSAGADVGETLDREGGVTRMEAFARLYSALEALPVPSICVCVGDVVGAGTEIAMGADLRVGGDNLRMQWVGGVLGVPVGVARLVPLVGLAVAKDLLLTGRRLDLSEAVELQLVSRGAATAEAEPIALAMAEELARRPTAGPRQIKAMLRDQERSAGRVAYENEVLVDWQRHGAGLPQGSAPE